MNKKLISLILALLISAVFYWYIIEPNNGFNLIVYSIHESISPGGRGESTFIRSFDVLLSFAVFLIFYKLLRVILK